MPATGEATNENPAHGTLRSPLFQLEQSLHAATKTDELKIMIENR